MPKLGDTYFELGVYVAPEHLEAFRAVLGKTDDNCLLLDIEKTIGVHIDHEQQGYANTRPALFPGHIMLPDYGEGVAEVCFEGEGR